MRIIRLAWDYPVRGQATYGLQPVFVYLSKEQAKLGNEVHIVTTSSNGAPLLEEERNLTVHRVRPPFTINALREVRRLLNSKEVVVHTHATCGFFISFTRKFSKFPLVSHVHGTSRSHFTPLVARGKSINIDYSSLSVNYHMLREKILWSSADRVLAVAKASSQDLIDSYSIDPEKIRVVYNGVDVNLFKPVSHLNLPSSLEYLKGKRVILYVGHFGLRKGIFYLIRAMPDVVKEFPDAHLLCIGGVPKWLKGADYWSILRREIESAGVSANVTLMNSVPNKELVNYYNLAEVFVLPSYYETFSKVSLEAMACAKPVITTNMGGLPEVVQDGVTGLLLPYGSVPFLRQAIIDILGDQRKARSMGKRGRERAERLFTWSAVALRIQEVYKEFL